MPTHCPLVSSSILRRGPIRPAGPANPVPRLEPAYAAQPHDLVDLLLRRAPAHGDTVAENLMNKDFTAEPGYAQAYEAQLAKAVQAWSSPQAWAGDRNVMGSATPAAV